MAAARRKEEATQLRDRAFMEKSRAIIGKATLTDEPMKGVVKELTVVARRTMGSFLLLCHAVTLNERRLCPGEIFFLPRGKAVFAAGHHQRQRHDLARLLQHLFRKITNVPLGVLIRSQTGQMVKLTGVQFH